MKIAISATGRGMNSEVDERFGRCPNYVIVEIEGGTVKSSHDLENTAAGQAGGAGMTASQLVGNQGVDAVVTGNLGPRAFQVFVQLGIKAYRASGKVRQAAQSFARGQLEEITEPGGPGMMGMPAR